MSGAAGIGSGHLKAKAYVDTFQNPFGDFIKNLITPIWKANADKTLTFDKAKEALDSFNQEWTAFDQASQQFKAMGGDFAKVVNQAYDPNKDFMKTVTNVRQSLTTLNDALKPADTSSSSTTGSETNPPTAGTLLAPLGQTPEGQARAASVQTKKKALAAPGFLSTLLGGGQGSATTQRKTLLGY